MCPTHCEYKGSLAVSRGFLIVENFEFYRKDSDIRALLLGAAWANRRFLSFQTGRAEWIGTVLKTCCADRFWSGGSGLFSVAKGSKRRTILSKNVHGGARWCRVKIKMKSTHI